MGRYLDVVVCDGFFLCRAVLSWDVNEMGREMMEREIPKCDRGKKEGNEEGNHVKLRHP